MNKHFRFEELSEKAKKDAHDRFAWDFSKNKPVEETEETILSWLHKHWFDNTGGTILSGLTDEEKESNKNR